jgi:hypothetical protein
MRAGKYNYHQNRPGLAFGLMVLFVILTALCPIKRIFFNTVNVPVLHQHAKITNEKPTVDLQELQMAGTGICGISYVTFKQSITHQSPVNIDCVALFFLVFTFLSFFKAYNQREKLIPAPANYFTPATPIFLRNQLFLI